MTFPVHWDVIVLGAGAAGLMCASEAGRRGRRVLLVDHMPQPGAKIRVSGGGHCNVTNRNLDKSCYLSEHPGFCLAALRQFDAQAMLRRLAQAGIAVEERQGGQYFCLGSAQQVVNLLVEACRTAQVAFSLGNPVGQVERLADGYLLQSQAGPFSCSSLVVATGGLSFPKLGATDWGHRLARRWGLSLVPPRPGLVPLLLPRAGWLAEGSLAGVAVEAVLRYGKVRFAGPLLFTHRGLSGPALLQISSYWQSGGELRINLLPGVEMGPLFRQARAMHPRQEVVTVLTNHLPRRLAQALLEGLGIGGRVAEVADARLRLLIQAVQDWRVIPTGSEGYRTAEVTTGGVDTRELSAQTLECRTIPGLYFIGEVVDVTGHLGGYNLQWAWSSGYAAGQSV
ncbi:MAG: NAD(P)/FAD-dependent oxidoreductase [Magnetococcales bacterium]|nr:NAD(P)/FAD-dependent oxidoreductase [Magnetococcales bacterium]